MSDGAGADTAPDDPSSATPPRRSFRLVLEYAGGGFEGWQVQSRQTPVRTVQGELERALEVITGQVCRVRGAGRTDAGVHALGQVASLTVETALPAEKLARALNARLPRDLAVLACDEVEPGWDALREARSKLYRYQIWNGACRSPLREARWYWMRDALDLERMREAGAVFVGRHDFAAFRAAGSAARTTVRTIRRLEIHGRTRDEIWLEVDGEGFLRHMVRNLAGTLIEIGRGRWEVERAARILASGDRGQAGPTAPAKGLVMVCARDSFSESQTAVEGGVASPRGPSIDEESPVG